VFLRAGVEAVIQLERQLLSDVRRYTRALQRIGVTVVCSLLFILLTAIATRLLGAALCWSSRDHSHRLPQSRDPADDDVTPARPATVSVNAQKTRSGFSVYDMRFSETKV